VQALFAVISRGSLAIKARTPPGIRISPANSGEPTRLAPAGLIRTQLLAVELACSTLVLVPPSIGTIESTTGGYYLDVDIPDRDPESRWLTP
jgi:hypothetical protein